MRHQAGVLALLALATAGSVFVLLDRPFMPANYSFDEEKIASVARGEARFLNDRSFQLVGDIYGTLGMAYAPILAAIVGYLSYLLVLFAAVRGQRLSAIQPSTVAIMAGSVVLAAVYLGHYSKDVFVLPVVFVVMTATIRWRTWRGDAAVLGAMLLYAYWFRSYWFIIAACYLTFRIATARRFNPLRVVTVTIVLLTILAVAFQFVLDVPLDSFRTRVNDARLEASANTTIEQFFPSGNLGYSVLNCVLVLLNFIVPVALLLAGSPIHVATALFLAFMWVMVFKSVRVLVLGHRYAVGGIARGLCFLFSILLVQSVFEPDYGSFVRHIAPVLPLVLLIILEARRESQELADVKN